MDENLKKIVEMFDLEDFSSEERDEFIQDFGDTIMKTVIRKAWSELDSEKKEEFSMLLQESGEDPENTQKHEAVLLFLDEHVPNAQQYAKKEIEQLQNSYRENRDMLIDLQG